MSGKSVVKTPVILKKWACRRDILGITKLMLLMDAATREPLLQVGHESRASPTVKNRWQSTVWGTFAGYRAELRLRRLLPKLVAKEVSFWEGILGIIMKSEVLELELTYCKIAVAVLLSTETGASMNERAAMKYLPLLLLAWSKAFVVCQILARALRERMSVAEPVRCNLDGSNRNMEESVNNMSGGRASSGRQSGGNTLNAGSRGVEDISKS